MSGISLSRLFWYSAAAILIVAALVAMSAVAGGSFDDNDWKVLATLLSLLVAGATAVSGLALVERKVLPALGWVAVVGAGGSFLVQVLAIWTEFDTDTLSKWAAGSIAIVLALLARHHPAAPAPRRVARLALLGPPRSPRRSRPLPPSSAYSKGATAPGRPSRS